MATYAPEDPHLATPLTGAPAGLVSACLNCGATLTGEFCADCGQRDLPPDPTVRELAAEAWEAFASVDGKVLSSLRLLLFRPGVLTTEYLLGRRVRHLTPLRLYLLCSVAYFLVSSLVPDRSGDSVVAFSTLGDTVKLTRPERGRDSLTSVRAARDEARKDDTRRAALARHGITAAPGALDSATRVRADSVRLEEQISKWDSAPGWFRARLVHGISGVQRDKKDFTRDYQAQLPRLMFVLMPVSALLLGLAYRSRRRRYPAHLIVALHLHAFVFAMFAVDDLRALLPAPSLVLVALKTAVALWICAYLPLALRRVYGGRLHYAVLRTVVVVGAYLTVFTVVFGLMALGLLLMY